MAERVIIIGGGLAGLAAATALAPRGFQVTILEARPRLGGRASSFLDTSTGQLIDNCQHVSMGCCTNFAHFCRTAGIAQYLSPQPVLYFMTPDGKVSRLSADNWPAPFHLARSFLAAHYLSWNEKLRIAWGLASLARSNTEEDTSFTNWLTEHRQTTRTIERFWSTVLTSALNESPERVGVRYARKVFVDGFLRHPGRGMIELPNVPLGRLYGEELQTWLDRHQVEVRLNEAVRKLHLDRASERQHLAFAIHGLVQTVELRSGEQLEVDWVISAVSFDRVLNLLPGEVTEKFEYFSNLRRLEPSPITSVHLWYDRPVLRRPHVVLIDCVGQWVFNRGETATGEYGVQVVVSASRRFHGMKHEAVQQLIVSEMARLFPICAKARLIRARVITEQSATFSAVPGVDRWRPAQASPIGNLFLAGDWTNTGWPATMESAVRSGYLAAEALLARAGRPERLVRPDLVEKSKPTG